MERDTSLEGAMNAAEQCWAMNGDGSRCTEPAQAERRFCKYHGRHGGPSPLWIWRAPVSAAEADGSTRRREDTKVDGAEPDGSGVEVSALSAPVSLLPDSASSRLRVDPTDAPAAPPAEGLAWFMALLQQAMAETMAGEGTPLQKAGAVARLGNLYLKAHRSAELAQANKELRRQIERLEEHLAAAEARLAALAHQSSAASGNLGGSALLPNRDDQPGVPDDVDQGSKGDRSRPVPAMRAARRTHSDESGLAAARGSAAHSRSVAGLGPEGHDQILPAVADGGAGLPGEGTPLCLASEDLPPAADPAIDRREDSCGPAAILC